VTLELEMLTVDRPAPFRLTTAMRLSHTWRRGRDRQNRARPDAPQDRSIEHSKGYGGGDKDEKHEPHHCVASISDSTRPPPSLPMEHNIAVRLNNDVSKDPIRPG